MKHKELKGYWLGVYREEDLPNKNQIGLYWDDKKKLVYRFPCYGLNDEWVVDADNLDKARNLIGIIYQDYKTFKRVEDL